METHEFCHHFRSSIRVVFDWKQFCASDWKIEHFDLLMPDVNEFLFTPWYLQNGFPCSYNHPQAKPQSVKAAAQNLTLQTCHNVSPWHETAAVLELPCYRLHQDKVLLLDGNHRAVGGQMSKASITVAAFVINGPLDARVCPDLMHWV